MEIKVLIWPILHTCLGLHLHTTPVPDTPALSPTPHPPPRHLRNFFSSLKVSAFLLPPPIIFIQGTHPLTLPITHYSPLLVISLRIRLALIFPDPISDSEPSLTAWQSTSNQLSDCIANSDRPSLTDRLSGSWGLATFGPFRWQYFKWGLGGRGSW